MSERVEVKFGANTTELDQKSKKAEQDIKGVGNAATGLRGALAGIRDKFREAFGGAKSDINDASSAVDGMGGRFSSLASVVQNFRGLFIAAFVAIGGAIAVHGIQKLIEFGREMSGIAEQTQQTAQILGMTATQISGLNAVAQTADMSAGQMRSSLVRLERSMVAAANGGRQQAAAFRALNVDVTQARNPMQALMMVADGMKNMPDGPRKTAAALTLMGRAGAQNIPILSQGSAAIQEMIRDAEQLGAVMSEEMVATGLEVDDAIDRMDLGFQGLKNTLFTALAPAITMIVRGLTYLVQMMIQSYRQGGLMKIILDALTFTLRVIATVVIIVGTAFSMAFNAAKAAVDGVIGSVLYLKELLSGGGVAGMIRGTQQGIREVVDERRRTGGGRISNAPLTEAERARIRERGNAGSAPDHSGSAAWFRSSGQAARNLVNAPGEAARLTGRVWGAGSGRRPTPTSNGENEAMDLDMPGSGSGSSNSANNQAAQQRMQMWLEEMRFKQDLARDDYDEQVRLQDQIIERSRAFYGADSAEYAQELRTKTRMARDHSDERRQMDAEDITNAQRNHEAGVDAWREHESLRIENARANIEELAELGEISEREKVARLRALLDQQLQMETDHEDRLYEIRVKAVQDQLALDNVRPEERRRLNALLESLEEDHQNKMALIQRRHRNQVRRADAEAVRATVARWRGIVEPITGAMQSVFTGLLRGTESFRSLMFQALDGLVSHFIQKGFEMLTQWITMELAKTGATTAGAAARTGAEVAAATTGATVGSAAAMTQVTNNAAVSASGAYASTVVIPFIGPVAAPVAAAVALAAVLGFGALIASARGGYDIPAGTNPLTQLHEKEMVLPAHIAEPLRRSLRGAGPRSNDLAGRSALVGSSARSETSLRGRGGEGDIHIHAVDARSFERLLKSNRRGVARQIRAGARDRVGS